MPPPLSDPVTTPDWRACRALLRGGSRTFHAASYLLPRHVRDPAGALYAFCRLADDAVDQGGAETEAVANLRARLARIYERGPLCDVVDQAFAEVVHHFAIPRALPEALIEGFEWDACGRDYEDLAQLNAYAARVAGTVGAMMSLLMGARSEAALARACDLGVAMQLSNIARDVGEDARNGRLYLPRTWMRDERLDPDAWLQHPVFSPALARVVQRLVDAADGLYARAADGVALLPTSCRPGIRAAAALYRGIGHTVLRAGGDSVTRRAVVPPSHKVRLLAGALLPAAPGLYTELPPLDQTQFLVDAVAATAPARLPEHAIGRLSLQQRLVRVIELFERLERRQQALGQRP